MFIKDTRKEIPSVGRVKLLVYADNIVVRTSPPISQQHHFTRDSLTPFSMKFQTKSTENKHRNKYRVTK